MLYTFMFGRNGPGQATRGQATIQAVSVGKTRGRTSDGWVDGMDAGLIHRCLECCRITE